MPLVIKVSPAANIVIKTPARPGSDGAAAIFTAGTLNIGDKARFRSLSNGVIFEVKDLAGNWQEVWTQTNAT